MATGECSGLLSSQATGDSWTTTRGRGFLGTAIPAPHPACFAPAMASFMTFSITSVLSSAFRNMQN
jgi:hypothetical protein